MKELVLSIWNKSIKEQEYFLKSFIDSWKAGTEQGDDICIIGVKNF
jgi:hypothetical protein